MTNRKYYSLRDLSLELDIPKSTIVKYKDFFPEFFPLFGEGKRKKFDDTAVDALKMIRDMREIKKRDWMEIRESLTEKFGGPLVGAEPAAAAAAPAEAPAAASRAVINRMDYLGHLFTALTGEVVRLGEQIQHIEQRQSALSKAQIAIYKRQSFQSKKTAQSMDRLQHELEAVFIELMDRDAGNRKRILQLRKELLGRFGETKHAVNKLAAAVRVPPAGENAANLEEFQKLEEKIDRLAREGAFNHGKYQVLLRENEMLKRKLQEESRRYDQAPQPTGETYYNAPAEDASGQQQSQKGGFLGLFRKSS